MSYPWVDENTILRGVVGSTAHGLALKTAYTSVWKGGVY